MQKLEIQDSKQKVQRFFLLKSGYIFWYEIVEISGYVKKA